MAKRGRDLRQRDQRTREECKKAKEEAQEKFWKQVDEMLMAHSTGVEIAAFFDISADCLYERCKRQKRMDFSVYAQSKTFKGKTVLRVSQFHKAVKEKSCTMQIHLGKQWLGQTDREIIRTEETEIQKVVLKVPDNEHREIKDEDGS